jgi:hypothetical protein
LTHTHSPGPASPTTWPAAVHVVIAVSALGSGTARKVSIALEREPDDDDFAGEVHQAVVGPRPGARPSGSEADAVFLAF